MVNTPHGKVPYFMTGNAALHTGKYGCFWRKVPRFAKDTVEARNYNIETFENQHDIICTIN